MTILHPFSSTFPTLHLFFFFFPLLLLPSLFSSAQDATLPLLASVTKDPASLRYTAVVHLQTPPQPTNLLIDLNAAFSWVDCSQNHTSSAAYLHVPCFSPLCATLQSSPFSFCINDSCSLFLHNPISRRTSSALALLDAISLPATNGRNPGPFSVLPHHLFLCANTSTLLKGLPKPAAGLLALGQSNLSLPAQVSKELCLPRKFALCLSGSPSTPGVAFLGTGGPYFFLRPPQSEVDISASLTYTPLISNPSNEYFINVTGIKVNGVPLPLNASTLSVNEERGTGGTKLSTLAPFTAMQAPIYETFVNSFAAEAAKMNLQTVEAVKPFDVCFSTEDIERTATGPAVPTIDLVMMDREDVYWRIFGANSMVWVNEGRVMCLGFVKARRRRHGAAAIVVGGHQMDDNLVQFDLEEMRVGFSSSLLLSETSCSNFNFTSATF